MANVLMEPHGQRPWYLHEIPACADRRGILPVRKPKASAGYPPVAESAVAFAQWHTNDLTAKSAFIHGQSPCLHAEVHVFVEGPRAGNGFGTQAWSSAKADKNIDN